LKPEAIKVKLIHVKQEKNVKESIAQTREKGQVPLKNLICYMFIFRYFILFLFYFYFIFILFLFYFFKVFYNILKNVSFIGFPHKLFGIRYSI